MSLQLDNLVDREANMLVDINSTKSVRHVLFEVLKLEVPNSRKTRTGKIRTDADVRLLGSIPGYLRPPKEPFSANASCVCQIVKYGSLRAKLSADHSS